MEPQTQAYLIAVAAAWPIVTAPLLACTRSRWIARAVAWAECLAAGIALLGWAWAGQTARQVDPWSWPGFGTNLHVISDAISAPWALVCAIVTAGVLHAERAPHRRAAAAWSCGAAIGLAAAGDMLLAAAFAGLLPIGALAGRIPDPARHRAIAGFALAWAAWLFVLTGVLWTAWRHVAVFGALTFDIPDLAGVAAGAPGPVRGAWLLAAAVCFALPAAARAASSKDSAPAGDLCFDLLAPAAGLIWLGRLELHAAAAPGASGLLPLTWTFALASGAALLAGLVGATRRARAPAAAFAVWLAALPAVLMWRPQIAAALSAGVFVLALLTRRPRRPWCWAQIAFLAGLCGGMAAVPVEAVAFAGAAATAAADYARAWRGEVAWADPVGAAVMVLGQYALAVLLAATALAYLRRCGRRVRSLSELRGLARTHPGPAAAVGLSVASSAGAPLTLGFWAAGCLLGVPATSGSLVGVAVVAAALATGATFAAWLIARMFRPPAQADAPAPDATTEAPRVVHRVLPGASGQLWRMLITAEATALVLLGVMPHFLWQAAMALLGRPG